jgi:hypothetical protein
VGKLNWARVILGGLVAGLISLASGYVLGHVFLKEVTEAIFERFHIVPTLHLFLHVLLLRLMLGIGVVWLYAAIRPRFGPGPRTAAIAGLIMWLFVWVYYSASIHPMGIYPHHVTVIALLWTFVEMQLMAQAGGYLYKES